MVLVEYAKVAEAGGSEFEARDYTFAGQWWCMLLNSALRRQSQADLCKFEVSLI